MNANENQIVVCQPNEAVRPDVRLGNETAWLAQEQIIQKGPALLPRVN